MIPNNFKPKPLLEGGNSPLYFGLAKPLSSNFAFKTSSTLPQAYVQQYIFQHSGRWRHS